jgi:hypothetical protein
MKFKSNDRQLGDYCKGAINMGVTDWSTSGDELCEWLIEKNKNDGDEIVEEEIYFSLLIVMSKLKRQCTV